MFTIVTALQNVKFKQKEYINHLFISCNITYLLSTYYIMKYLHINALYHSTAIYTHIIKAGKYITRVTD